MFSHQSDHNKKYVSLLLSSEPHIQTTYKSSFDFSGLHNYHFTPTTKGGYWRPIPIITHEGPLQFEIIMFAYMTVALLLQHLHIYKSVWWLPHSYNAYAMVGLLSERINILYVRQGRFVRIAFWLNCQKSCLIYSRKLLNSSKK